MDPQPRAHEIARRSPTAIANDAVTLPPPAPPETATISPASDADAGDLPRQAGRFHLLGEIARGGMGVVLRGRDPDLGRDLAVKVVLARHGEQPELVHRFLDEAQLAGQLQHPGVVPIYELGKLDDGRPFFAMKLIQGRTLAELLSERPNSAHELPRFVRYFEAICQTVGYAHAQGVIHRDLKPLNVMVGAFGEVQVMDWGLAKVLPHPSAQPPPRNGEGEPALSPLSLRSGGRGGGGEGATQAGAVVGTPAYIAPEQAIGEVERVDRRSDVFGLGAILCEILTGAAPFRGDDVLDMLVQSATGHLTDAFTRLDGCGADPELVELAKKCLAPRPEDRPADGSAVAEAVSAHLSGVQERLRQAEVGQARAEARAEGERNRRRLTAALAAAVLLLLVGGGSGAWLWQHQRETVLARQRELGQKTLAALERGGALLEDGWQTNDGSKLQAAKVEAERAVVTAAGGADAEVRQQAADFAGQVAERLLRWEKNRELLSALLDISEPRETRTYQVDQNGQMMPVAQPSTNEQYASAFRRWGVDVQAVAEAQFIERLQAEPESVRAEILAGLDGWMFHLRTRRGPADRWQRLLRIAEKADRNERRSQLRLLLAGQGLVDAAAVASVAAGLADHGKCLSALTDLQRARQEQLQKLRSGMEPATEPVASVLLLARVCTHLGDRAGAEEVLRQAVAARPTQVVFFDTLGKILEGQKAARLGEAIECYRAARVARPQLGVALGKALLAAGRESEAEAVMRDLVRQQPNNPQANLHLGLILDGRKKPAEAETAYRKAVALRPDYAVAHYNLGLALHNQKKIEEAETAYRKAIALRPGYAVAYNNLGVVLQNRKMPAEAEAAYRKVIALQPRNARAHYNLGNALRNQKKLSEAVVAYRKAIAIQPDQALARTNLGFVLLDQKKLTEAEEVFRTVIALQPNDTKAHDNLGVALFEQQRLDEAEAAHRQAIVLKPDNALAHNNLGVVLRAQKNPVEAEAAYRRAMALDPEYAEPHYNLGNLLKAQKKFAEAETAYRKAIALQTDHANAYNNLGLALREQKRPAEAEAAFRKAIAIQPDDAKAHDNLGLALLDQQKLDEAEACHRKALSLQPDCALAHNSLGIVLRRRNKPVEAEAAFRKAMALDPNYADPPHNLGNLLRAQKRSAEAEAAYRTAIALAPEDHTVHNSLGLALQDQEKHAEAEAALRRAIAIKPDYAPAHNNLGITLRALKKPAEAEAAYRKAILLRPNYPEANYNLGNLLRAQKRPAEAEAAYRKAIASRPTYADAHYFLGNLLRDQKKSAAAEIAYRKAVALNPDSARAHYHLGNVLYDQKKQKEAEAAYRKAIAIEPDHARAHNNLGNTLRDQKRHKEAEAAYRKAIAIQPDLPEPYNNLHNVLRDQKKLAEALEFIRKAAQLLPNNRIIRNNLRRTENLLRLDRKLAACMDGKERPTGAQEAAELGSFCATFHERYRLAVSFYTEAFQADAKLASDLKASHRYNAARYAVLAALGKGKDAPAAVDRAKLRRQALDWLRADLKLYGGLFDEGQEGRATVHEWLGRWLASTDLAGVRDKDALNKLPQAERDDWARLWTEVKALRDRAASD